MVATLILETDENGDMHDQEVHLRNASCQRAVIPEQDDDISAAVDDAAQAVNDAARPRMLADYNHPNPYYANKYAICPPSIQRTDFELKPQYFTLVAQTPYCGLSQEHPMAYLERFEDLVSSIKANGVPEDYLFCKLFKYSLAVEASRWLKQLPHDLSHHGMTSRMRSCAISLMSREMRT